MPESLSRVYHPAPRDPITEAAARVLSGRAFAGDGLGRRIWLVREVERVIIEADAPARVRPQCAPNVFFSFDDASKYTRRCTVEWIDLVLTDIEEMRCDPVADPTYWEALARLEYLHDHGWPVVKE